MIPLPEAFVSRMHRQLGNELPDFLHALSLPPVRGIRMNIQKPFDGMASFSSGCRIPWTENGYILESESSAGSTVFHEAGAFYLQEPAAMLPAEVMDVHPGDTVLDLCGAPGGKSTQMAEKMHGAGVIVCNEPVLKRAQVLSRNIERIGIANSIVTCSYPSDFPHTWNESFDAVLVDAPCSGEGMFRRDPETRTEWTQDKASGCARRQREILAEAARFVRPGGKLVYSTCTYNPEENEENINTFLQNHADFALEAFQMPEVDGKDGMFLCYPHRNAGEGQFVAKLRKKGISSAVHFNTSFSLVKKDEIQFFRSAFPSFPHPNVRFGNVYAAVPPSPDLDGVRVLRAGLHLFEIKGKTFIPDHAVAICMNPLSVTEKELTEDEVRKYISGGELKGHEKGWTLMKYKGLRVGWGKGSDGRITNHYPKGLRKERILTES